MIDINLKISKNELLKLIKVLNEIDSEIDSYMVRGNHDYTDNFNELIKGTDSRKEFFNRIIEVITLLGGDSNNVF